VLALDLPATAAATARRFAGVEALADWVLALLDAAGVRKAALVGHSMGSPDRARGRGPGAERVGRLVLLGTAVPMKVSDALMQTSQRDPLKAIDMVNAFSHSGTASEAVIPRPRDLAARIGPRPDARVQAGSRR
jgi:pimeloyl-ACP methyl ester carboxylesterase